MKADIQVVPGTSNHFKWQSIANRLNSYGFIRRLHQEPYLLELRASGTNQEPKSSDFINQENLYTLASPDDFCNDFNFFIFYDQSLSYNAADAYDFLLHYDKMQLMADLKARAEKWHHLAYIIGFTAQANCGKKAAQWFFGYILAFAEVFDGLIIIDEDAELVGTKPYGQSFKDLSFGIYTPDEFRAVISLLHEC